MSETAPLYGVLDLIPISQIVARTKVRLQLQDVTDYDPEIELFINEAAMMLGTKPTFKKQNLRLDIVNGRAKLPCGFKRLHGVRMVAPPLPPSSSIAVNSIWTTQNPVFGDVVYMDRAWITEAAIANIDGNIIGSVGAFNDVMEIIGNYLVFPVPCPYEHCFISFDGFATNACDGCILELHPQYERCFSEYAVSMMLQSHPQLWNNEWGNRENAVQRAYDIYVAQRNKLVSDAFAEDATRNKYMFKRILNGLLQDQNSAILP